MLKSYTHFKHPIYHKPIKLFRKVVITISQTIICQIWVKNKKDISTDKPDGYSLHLDHESRKQFINQCLTENQQRALYYPTESFLVPTNRFFSYEVKDKTFEIISKLPLKSMWL